MALATARNLNPILLIAGTLVAPIATAALGRTFLTIDPKAKDQEAEIRSVVGKFALLNGAVAAGLGYGASKAQTNVGRSAALGGAVGTALIAGLLGSTVVFTPKSDELNAQPAAGRLLQPRSRVANGFVSNLVGIQ